MSILLKCCDSSRLSAPGVPVVDERQSSRPLAMKTADLEFGAVLLPCTILNWSEKGLQVCVPRFRDVAQRVLVRFSDGTTRPAIQRWRRETDIGLEFLNT